MQARYLLQHLKITQKALPLYTGYKKRKKVGKFSQRDFLTYWSQHRASAWKKNNFFVIEIFSEKTPVISIYIIKRKEGAYGLD